MDRVALAATCLLASTWCVAAEEVVTIPTREGVTESYLLTHDATATPKIALIAFIGGTGAIELAKRAQAGPVRFGSGANALIRMRNDVANKDIAYVLVDAPSDRLPQGMNDEFRMSAAHAADIRAVISDLRKRYPGVRIDLIGTSRGTISVAPLAVALGDSVHGAVLSSSVTVPNRAGERGLSGFDFATIKVPVLFVHHRDDGCRLSPYGNVTRIAKEDALVTVDGGNPPQSDACEPLSPHGYFGREAQVAQAIQHWLLGEEFPHEIR